MRDTREDRWWRRLLRRHHQPRSETQLEPVHDLLASLIVLAWVVEARDPYTGGHLWRVSRYSRLLAEAAETGASEVARVTIGALVHDLGKIGVPDSILRKPDRLDDRETAIMRTHPEIGARMLAGHPLGRVVREIVLLHHERPDGLGYPNGFRTPQIPVAARIVSICDAFDAMTSHRPFRSGMAMADAHARMREQVDQQFDRELLHLFEELGRQGLLQHIHGHSDAGIPLSICPTCGPTLVVRREQHAGEAIHCPNCTTVFTLVDRRRDGGWDLAATGRHADARTAAPAADEELIRRLVSESVTALRALVRDEPRPT